MASDTQIRRALRDAGHDVPVRGRLGEEWREIYAATQDSPEGDNPGLSAVPPMEGQTAIPMPDPADSGEIAPVRPASSRTPTPASAPVRGMKGLFGKSPTAPKMQHKRRSLEEIAAEGWGLMATLVGSKGLQPTARVLQLQAPVAGVILEDALRGTLADRLLQPIVRHADSAREVSALIGPPVIVTLLTLRPELAPQLIPILRRNLRTWLTVAGPKLKALEKREAKLLEELGLDQAEDLDNAIDAMISGFWTMEAAPGPAGVEEQPRAA